MPPLRFYEDLAEAQNSEISRVSDIGRGDDSGALKFTYHHETLSGPVTIHMMAHGECSRSVSNAASRLISAAQIACLIRKILASSYFLNSTI